MNVRSKLLCATTAALVFGLIHVVVGIWMIASDSDFAIFHSEGFFHPPNGPQGIVALVIGVILTLKWGNLLFFLVTHNPSTLPKRACIGMVSYSPCVWKWVEQYRQEMGAEIA